MPRETQIEARIPHKWLSSNATLQPTSYIGVFSTRSWGFILLLFSNGYIVVMIPRHLGNIVVLMRSAKDIATFKFFGFSRRARPPATRHITFTEIIVLLCYIQHLWSWRFVFRAWYCAISHLSEVHYKYTDELITTKFLHIYHNMLWGRLWNISIGSHKIMPI